MLHKIDKPLKPALPAELKHYLKYCRGLGFAEKPDYAMVQWGGRSKVDYVLYFTADWDPFLLRTVEASKGFRMGSGKTPNL